MKDKLNNLVAGAGIAGVLGIGCLTVLGYFVFWGAVIYLIYKLIIHFS